MPADALLAEVFRRSDQLLAAWAVHAAVGVALVALAAAVPLTRGARRALAGLFAFLAFANLEAMLWILKQWGAVADALTSAPGWAPVARSFAEVVNAPHPLWVVPFHVLLDGFVVAAVLRLGRTRDGVLLPS